MCTERATQVQRTLFVHNGGQILSSIPVVIISAHDAVFLSVVQACEVVTIHAIFGHWVNETDSFFITAPPHPHQICP